MVAGNNINNVLRQFNIDYHDNIKSVNNGVNSNVYIIEDKYILKFYRKDNNNPTRLERELYALNLFEKHKIENVPQIINYSKKYDCILMSFLKGDKVELLTSEYINQFATFYSKLLQISSAARKNCFDSIDSCPTLDLLLNQIKKRIINLKLEKNSQVNKIILTLEKYMKFLENKINPTFYNNLNTELSVVDFGINNTLSNDNKLVFFDFEFFGIDNPVHLISDTIAHPANNLCLNDQIIFSEALNNCHFNKSDILQAFNGTNILFDIKWCLIMLNPFLKTYKLNINQDDMEFRKTQQLIKVENKISIIDLKLNNENFLHN